MNVPSVFFSQYTLVTQCSAMLFISHESTWDQTIVRCLLLHCRTSTALIVLQSGNNDKIWPQLDKGCINYIEWFLQKPWHSVSSLVHLDDRAAQTEAAHQPPELSQHPPDRRALMSPSNRHHGNSLLKLRFLNLYFGLFPDCPYRCCLLYIFIKPNRPTK